LDRLFDRATIAERADKKVQGTKEMFPGGLTKMLYGQYEANKKEMKKNKAKSSCVCVCV
jgi:hypothetical protein